MLDIKQSVIQISRSKYIESSREIAIIRLNEDIEHYPGQPILIRYRKESPDKYQGNVDSILAIGIKQGYGEDCYRVIDLGGRAVVRDITESIPDVSSLVHGEIYVWKNPEDEKWMYVYKNEDEPNRLVKDYLDETKDVIFYNLEDGYIWFYTSGKMKRADDFFTIGETQNLIENALNSNFEVVLQSNSGQLYREGTVNDIEFQLRVTNTVTGEDITDRCTYKLNGVDLVPERDGSFIVNNVSNNIDYSIMAIYPLATGINVNLKSNIIRITFGNFFYFGPVSSNWVANATSIQNLTRRLWYNATFKVNDIRLEKQRYVLAYPYKYGNLEHIFDVHGLDYIYTYEALDEKVKIDGVDYLVYLKKDVVSIIDLDQSFVFTTSESLENSEDNKIALLEIITAWKNRNTSSGLVVTDATSGKIDEDLYNLNASSSFTKLAGIVENEFPTSGMLRDELYYSKEQKLILKATSATKGILSTPESQIIYVYENDFYSWTGTSLQPFSRIGTKKINSIDEIYG